MDIFGSVMRVKFSIHRLLRLTALAALPLAGIYDLLKPGPPDPSVLCLDVWCPLLLLMLYPLPHDRPEPSVAASVLWLVLAVCLRVFRAPLWLTVCCGSTLAFVFFVYRCVGRFANVPRLFLSTTVWPGVLDQLSLLHLSAFLVCGCFIFALSAFSAGEWVLLAALLSFFALQYVRIYTRRTLFLSQKKEHLIRKAQKTSGYRMPIQYVDSESRSGVLFNEVVHIMETKKPFLQDDFSLDDLSRMVHTNRLYLSKTINYHAGRNFNRLVNYYRVKYAVDLIKKDSGLKMVEVSQMCGFHSVVSFNTSFKMHEHMTPGEFARSLKKIN